MEKQNKELIEQEIYKALKLSYKLLENISQGCFTQTGVKTIIEKIEELLTNYFENKEDNYQLTITLDEKLFDIRYPYIWEDIGECLKQHNQENLLPLLQKHLNIDIKTNSDIRFE